MESLKAGDIVFTSAQGGGFIAASIRFWTRTWFESKTFASHVAVVVEPAEQPDDVLIVEQTWPRIRMTSLGRYRHSGYRIYRDTRLSDQDRIRIREAALSARGKYGTSKIFLFLLDAFIGKVLSLPVVLAGLILGRRWKGFEPVIFSQINLSGSLVCSQFVAWLWWMNGYHLGGPWYAMTPDALLDHVEASHPQFERI